jgi:hypothetical protein
MSEDGDEQNDPLADLEPEERKSELTVRLVSLASSITAARSRRCSWGLIARRLSEQFGIVVSADHLRVTMERYASKKANTKRASKTNASSVVNKPKAASLNRPPVGQKTDNPGATKVANPPVVDQDLTTALVTLDILEQMKDVKADESQPPPAENPPPAESEQTSVNPEPDSDHAGLRRRNARP